MINQYICHLFLSLFYQKNWVIVYEDLVFYYFSEFINVMSIFYYTFIEFIILLYAFLVISFIRYKEYIIWQISLSKFSDVLPAFICERAIDNFRSICLEVNILIRVCFSIGKILLSISLRAFCRPFFFLFRFFGLVDSLNYSVSSFRFISSSSASFSAIIPLYISLPKDLIVLNFWKSYVLLFLLLPIL